MGNGDSLWIGLLSLVIPVHTKGRAVQVAKTMLNAEYSQRVRGHLGKRVGHSPLVKPIQCPSQAVVVELLRIQTFSDQKTYRLVGEELGGQIKRPTDEAQRVDHHRLHRLADRDLPLSRSHASINLFNKPDFIADASHDSQVI